LSSWGIPHIVSTSKEICKPLLFSQPLDHAALALRDGAGLAVNNLAFNDF
jgi:hypothetical protein